MTSRRTEATSYEWLADFGRSFAVWRKVVGVAGSAMCHDLNNPLQGVVGFADLLLQTVQSEDLKTDLQVILDGGLACRSLSDSFGNLADFFGPERVKVRLDELSKGVLFASLPEERWGIDIPEALREVWGDPVYLALVLHGLSSYPGGKVEDGAFRVSTNEEGELMLLCELTTERSDSLNSGPEDLDYWLGRRAARLMGGRMDRTTEGDKVVVTAHLPGLLGETERNSHGATQG